VVAFLAIQYVRSTRDLRTVSVAAVVSGSVVSVYTLLQYSGIDPIQWTELTNRVFSTFGNPDLLGSYLVFPLALSLGLAITTSTRWRAFAWWSTAALISSALVITRTRGAWLGALAMLLCFVFFGWPGLWRGSRRQRLVLGGMATAGTLAAAVAVVSIRARSAGAAQRLGPLLASISNGRTVVWLTGIRGWMTHPITGWGPDGFARAFDSAVGADWYALLASMGSSGLSSANNAHSLFVEALVTLGIPGLVLMTWALASTALQSFGGLRDAAGHARLLSVAVWVALIGMLVTSAFGVTTPQVSVWLWLTVGLLLAPLSHRVRAVPRAALVGGVVLGVVVALWAGSWLVADFMVGRAMQEAAGPSQVSALEAAVRLNPLSQTYRWLGADALVNQAEAEQRAGQGRVADETMNRAVAAYYAAAQADRGDDLVRIALANVLIRYASTHPGSDAPRRAVLVAQDASRLAPHDAVVLVILVRAYQAAGRLDDAEKTARLAREIAPAYSMQTLGSLGLGGTTTP
jgi:O-antigen ligase